MNLVISNVSYEIEFLHSTYITLLLREWHEICLNLFQIPTLPDLLAKTRAMSGGIPEQSTASYVFDWFGLGAK